MDIKKQTLLLEYLLSSPDTFSLCSSIIRSDYFDPKLRQAVNFIQQYHEDYNGIPTPEQIMAESDVALKKHAITSRAEIDYCTTEIESFCRRRALEKAVLASAELVSKGDYGKIESLVREALTTSLHKNLGVNYFENPSDRMSRMLSSGSMISTGWKQLDKLLYGGLNRKEMILFSANSGGGKSIVMANLGINLVEQGLNVLYISLELFEDIVAKRFDSMVTGVSQQDWNNRTTEIAQKIETKRGTVGNLFIKYMSSGTNCNAIRSYIKEFEIQTGFVPDVLIVDYLDLMGTNERMGADNVFEKDKKSSEELRNIGSDYNMYIVTASQQNRSAVGVSDTNHSHIAGGISKINTTDTYISILAGPIQMAAGEILFKLLKTRSSDGVGETIALKWDRVTLRVADPTNSPSDLKFASSEENQKGNAKGDSLLKLMQV